MESTTLLGQAAPTKGGKVAIRILYKEAMISSVSITASLRLLGTTGQIMHNMLVLYPLTQKAKWLECVCP
jgi:hypothetical protein